MIFWLWSIIICKSQIVDKIRKSQDYNENSQESQQGKKNIEEEESVNESSSSYEYIVYSNVKKNSKKNQPNNNINTQSSQIIKKNIQQIDQSLLYNIHTHTLVVNIKKKIGYSSIRFGYLHIMVPRTANIADWSAKIKIRILIKFIILFVCLIFYSCNFFSKNKLKFLQNY